MKPLWLYITCFSVSDTHENLKFILSTITYRTMSSLPLLFLCIDPVNGKIFVKHIMILVENR